MCIFRLSFFKEISIQINLSILNKFEGDVLFDTQTVKFLILSVIFNLKSDNAPLNAEYKPEVLDQEF